MADFNIEKNQVQLKYGLKNPATLLEKTISILLGAQSLYGLYESSKFIIFDRVNVEAAISNHQLDATAIDSYIGKIVLTIINAISLYVAVLLFGSKNKTSKNVQLVLGVILIIVNTYLMSFLKQIPFLEQILPAIDFS